MARLSVISQFLVEGPVVEARLPVTALHTKDGRAAAEQCVKSIARGKPSQERDCGRVARHEGVDSSADSFLRRITGKGRSNAMVPWLAAMEHMSELDCYCRNGTRCAQRHGMRTRTSYCVDRYCERKRRRAQINEARGRSPDIPIPPPNFSPESRSSVMSRAVHLDVQRPRKPSSPPGRYTRKTRGGRWCRSVLRFGHEEGAF
ncbi:hypothetical protein B0H16DRAFT_1469100 [Mycena metata]|uniref:Uncharacterized protein n=1 Tax=Mycena metata TaxID=1033252 RepID=A0AAD7HZB9_9AGAR|nr:hypothetical protein B0H16DRAFT_1469100 [Mycena metata]